MPSLTEEKEVVSAITPDNAVIDDVNADAVVAWLVTQPNANGTLYLDHVVRSYMSALRNAPQKLDLAASQSRNVFACHTIVEFDMLYEAFKAAPNYADVNRTSRHGQLSAGLAVYRRYLEHLEKDNVTLVCAQAKPSSPPATLPAPSGIIDLEEGRDGIREILNIHFRSLCGYSNSHILWDATRNALPLFLNDNAINSEDDLWLFLQRVFGTEFILDKPQIWREVPNYPRNLRGLIVNLARQNGGTVTREQIDDFFAKIKVAPPNNAQLLQQELLLFYERDNFILAETVEPSTSRCEAITKALDGLFSAEDDVAYIILRDISAEWFARLPKIKGCLTWTALLLQEVIRIRQDNISYRVIMSGLSGQAYYTLGAAISSKKSGVNNFSDVVHRFCYDKQYIGKRKGAEELRLELREAGILEGNELIYNLHKVLDYRFAFDHEKETMKILER